MTRTRKFLGERVTEQILTDSFEQADNIGWYSGGIKGIILNLLKIKMIKTVIKVSQDGIYTARFSNPVSYRKLTDDDFSLDEKY